eukprot:1721501-Alexandrium_andersonii.AAC.1
MPPDGRSRSHYFKPLENDLGRSAFAVWTHPKEATAGGTSNPHVLFRDIGKEEYLEGQHEQAVEDAEGVDHDVLDAPSKKLPAGGAHASGFG